MRGTIHECAVAIKAGTRAQVLLRDPKGEYQVVPLDDENTQKMFLPWSKRHGDIIGTYRRDAEVREIYDDADEPMPGD